MASHWKLEVGNIYTTEIGKHFKSGLAFLPLESQLTSTSLGKNNNKSLLPIPMFRFCFLTMVAMFSSGLSPFKINASKNIALGTGRKAMES